MKKRLSVIYSAVAAAVRSYPVEMGIILYAFVFGALIIEDVVTDNEVNIALAPLFFSLAYSLNSLIKCPRGRWAYYLCWLPIIPLWFVDVEDWVESSGYVVALACAFLAFLVCRKACDNRRFAGESFGYLFDLMLSFFFAGIAHMLLMAIYFSTVYIFGLDHDVIPNFLRYTSLVAYVLFVPLLFLSFVRSNIDRGFSPNKFFDMLLNHILTPALLIYTAILYIYFAKIAFTWSLPKGGIAIMVFVFALIAMIVKAWQPLLGKRYYERFFDNFSLVSLPAVVMFWVGSTYRIVQYGFTEWRFYLLLCGVIMTFTLAIFFCKGRGKYITAAIVSMALLSLFTFIPPLSAKNLSRRSQACRVERIAGRIGLLDADGNISKEARPESDTVYREDYHRLYESLSYLDKHDQPIYGLEYPGDIRDIFPGRWAGYGTYESDDEFRQTRLYLNNNNSDKPIDVSGFSKMYAFYAKSWKDEEYDYRYNHENDSLSIDRRPLQPHETDNVETGEEAQWERILAVSEDEIMQHSLSAASPRPVSAPDSDFLEQQEENPDFFTCDIGGMRFVFGEITLKGSNDTEWKIDYLSVKYILVK